MKQFVLGPDAANGVPISEGAHREGPLGTRLGKYRFNVDVETLIDKVIEERFKDKPYFKYASEVCELDLPLKDVNGAPIDAATRRAFWTKYHMTGDNARERPYSHIYPRLTTKSNVFTVHVWAQSIAKNPSTKKSEWGEFDENSDRILGEYRGSTTIERFIDAKRRVFEGLRYRRE
jgi:hypothetical protein